jgi:hypothetical protein
MLDIRTKDGPELYTGIALEVGEIIRAHAELTKVVEDITNCFGDKQTVSLMVQCDVATKLAWAISVMSEHVSKVTAQHLARKPRP